MEKNRSNSEMKSAFTVISSEKEETLVNNKQLFGPRRHKTCLRGFVNNTGADQPAHARSLISAFVIRFLENITCKLAIGEIPIF